MAIIRTELITGNCPASATSALIGTAGIAGLSQYDWFTIDAILIGPTGGTLDVTLQRKMGNVAGSAVDLWFDWLHFPQVAAATTKYYTAISGASTTIQAVGAVAAAAFTATLAANTFVGGHPGDQLRAVCTTGAGTSAAALQKIYVTAWNVKT